MAETADHFSLKIFAVSRLGRRYSWIADVVDCPGEQRVKRGVVDSVSGRREAVGPVLARIESSDKILHDPKWICQVLRGESLALNPNWASPRTPYRGQLVMPHWQPSAGIGSPWSRVSDRTAASWRSGHFWHSRSSFGAAAVRIPRSVLE
jgi:hypothetical protein